MLRRFFSEPLKAAIKEAAIKVPLKAGIKEADKIIKVMENDPKGFASALDENRQITQEAKDYIYHMVFQSHIDIRPSIYISTQLVLSVAIAQNMLRGCAYGSNINIETESSNDKHSNKPVL